MGEGLRRAVAAAKLTRKASKQDMLDRHVGGLVYMFDRMMDRALKGEAVDALKLQAGFNEVTRRAIAVARKEKK